MNKIWISPPVRIIQEFERRKPDRGEAGALAMWAVWSVEGLHYLQDLDDENNNRIRHDHQVHEFHVKDISHVRWATGTAITSIDLCAAILAKEYCAWTRKTEADLRDFDPTRHRRNPAVNRKMLSASALSWIDGVLSDSRYKEVQGARNPLFHSRLLRIVSSSATTEFKVPTTNSVFSATQLVTLSRDLATEQVKHFLKILEVMK